MGRGSVDACRGSGGAVGVRRPQSLSARPEPAAPLLAITGIGKDWRNQRPGADRNVRTAGTAKGPDVHCA